MFAPSKHHRLLLALAVLIAACAMVPARYAAGWYGHAFAGVLVDPDGLVSNFGLPTWDGLQKGLHYPDRILAIDGHALVAAPCPGPGAGYRFAAEVWDEVVEDAWGAGRRSVHVRAANADGVERELDLALSPLDPLGFWINGGAPIGIALLYVGGALVALAASPRGRLSRTFAKTSLFAALFLVTVFDYHTTRKLVPLFNLAFAMVPMGFFALALRLPDDVELLGRRPWIVGALDATGAALGLGMIASHLAGGGTIALRAVCTPLIAASFLFFAVTFLVRFARAEGDRRAIMRALLVAMVPPHAVLGIAFLLGSLSGARAAAAVFSIPALALTPLSTVVALIRHDLWGSRALLSRVLVRVVIGVITYAIAIALGAGLALVFQARARDALLAASVAGGVAVVLIVPALRVGDRVLFPARAVYKPTIEQLSEELATIMSPEEVGRAVERTVRRWLPCEKVELRLVAARGADDGEGAPADPPVSGVHSVRPEAPRDRDSEVGEIALLPPPDPSPPSLPELADELSIDVCLGGRLAVLHVGKKRGGALFTSEDVDLLRTIAHQAALALAHAQSYAELELRRRQQAAAWRGEREALVETVAAEIAHEVRYPINYFSSIFEPEDGGVHLDAEEVAMGRHEVRRLERLVSGLRRVTGRRIERRAVAVSELVLKTERLLRDRLGKRRLEVDLAGPAALRCDSDQITQVLVNLVSNALDAAGDEGRVGVTWTPTPDGCELAVWDTGPGFGDDPARLFAPWYTTKPRGTGLGLAITHRLVRAHGWQIDPVRTSSTTRFVVSVPHSDLIRMEVA
jgi:signal transduction histidine kinase